LNHFFVFGREEEKREDEKRRERKKREEKRERILQS